MKLEIKNINNSLNMAYLSQCPFVDEITLFKNNYLTLLKSIKQNDSEETLKAYIHDFLKNTYYQGKFASKVNVNNIDLVILNGKEIDDKIGVIIETKALKNNSEMITIDYQQGVATPCSLYDATPCLNKKAFQELIQSYLEERVINENVEIKHLIITNSIDWFIFNATEFERLFYLNKSFLKKYNQWHSGKLVSKNKDWFYTEIAKPFIENEQEIITCTHFQLTENAIENEQNLIELFKIFSPEHLLKLPFQNDSNTLNREFYNELLHIIGLQETKDKIQRLPIKQRNEGSLLENTISVLEQDEILLNLEQPTRYGETQEEQLFSIGLELCLTWLNRIIFLKLLESQLIKYNKNKDFAFLNTSKINNFDDLKELFFEVLAVPTNERKPKIRQKYSNVPYLNSSLFEQSQIEKETIRINQLKHNAELPLLHSTVIRNEEGKQINKNWNTLKYILEFLDSYNFASDNKVEIQETNKTIINSSVLGLIFEKINGYKEGSFYTPGYITMYICRETIRNAVIQKFNTSFGWECKTIAKLYNQIGKIETEKANEIFNSIHICDPAVGSGHFLVSALNELIAIKSELEILTDSEGKTLRNTYCEVHNDELFISYKGEIYIYDVKDKESQRIQETIFHEKQKLIENCIFGVDINPKSVNICRLRLWIELLKNAYYTKKSNFNELETLPNIDINIKCGNSLVSRFSLNGKGVSNGNIPKMQLATYQYKEQINIYKGTDKKIIRQNAEKKIIKIKNQFSTTVNPYDDELIAIRNKEAELKNKPILFTREEQIAWNNKFVEINEEIAELEKEYKQKLFSIYSNAFEWRFEFPEILDDNGNFIGFDVIIGNPPYGIFNKKQNQKTSLKTNDPIITYYKNRYKQAIEGMMNASKLFYLLGLNLLKPAGIIGMIIPYSFLADVSSSKLRKYLFENHSIIQIDAFPERDNPAKRIFEEAKISTAIIITKKNKIGSVINLGISHDRSISDERLLLTLDEIKKLSGEKLTIPLVNNKQFQVLKKVFANNVKLLGEFSECLTGEVDISIAKDAITDKNTKWALIKGVQIDRYTLKKRNEDISQGKIQFLDLQKFEKIYSGRKLLHSHNKRIALQGLTGVNEKRRIKATLIEENLFLANSCNYIIINDKISPKLLLALLNSKLFNFIFKCKSTNSNVNGYEINDLPIIEIKNCSNIEKLVDKILLNQEKKISYNFAKEEKIIDDEIYKLYNLSKEDIEVIDDDKI